MAATNDDRNRTRETRREYKTYGRSRSLRLPGFDYRKPGPYHIILGTRKRQPVLTRFETGKRVIALLLHEARDTDVTLHAYCLMPDHLHVLLSTGGAKTVLEFMRDFKGKSTRVYWSCGGNGALWQSGFYDHILRKQEDIAKLAEYILGNPVRKGFVTSVSEYPFSGSTVFDKRDL